MISPTEHHVLDTLAAAVEGARVATGERAILAVAILPDNTAGAAITLTLGESVGQLTRAGAILARLLAASEPGCSWAVLSVRQGGRVHRTEREAAERIAAAAHLVDVPLTGVFLVRAAAVDTIWAPAP